MWLSNSSIGRKVVMSITGLVHRTKSSHEYYRALSRPIFNVSHVYELSGVNQP